MIRREFITLLGGAAATWPVAARAQQPGIPVIGFLGLSRDIGRMTAFHRGLKEAGYVEGQNVAIEFRWAEGRYDQFPGLAADLVRRAVNVICAPANVAAALAAKAATSTIPIVFAVGDDPVRLGLVASLGRPGGNATGMNFFTTELVAKRLGVLLDLVPAATRVAVLVNPTSPTAGTITSDVAAAADSVKQQLRVVNASTGNEVQAAFQSIAGDHADALVVSPDPFFNSRRVQIATLAARHAIPAIYAAREYVEAGGLMSYSTNGAEVYHQVGVYAGRILRGTKAADLPVLRPTRFELVINLNTAKALGLDVPPMLLARADEVIE
jgi:putative ABC transport system substrate-binding protein